MPYAFVIFMLTPFALWLGHGLFDPEGGMVRIEGWLGAELLAASLPLARLFWIQNLRQLVAREERDFSARQAAVRAAEVPSR
jgi:hypothetical protein